jgi:hypothetical protein
MAGRYSLPSQRNPVSQIIYIELCEFCRGLLQSFQLLMTSMPVATDKKELPTCATLQALS